MLDPRIYRMGLVPVVLAVMVLAFSLSNQPGPLSTSLAPDAYSGANAYAAMNALAQQFPHRPPGSAADARLARYVAAQLGPRGYQFSVTTDTFRAPTADGRRTLQNVIATRAGQQNGSIILVASRDALGSPATTQLSGTAVLLELARVLSGETLQHTVVLASISGSAGGAGAAELARTLPQPVDGVIVLGDVAAASVREPIVVPWSNDQRVAPPLLRNTVAAALQSQAALGPGSTGLLGQLAHLALPMAASAQAPLNSAGLPAVLVSLSGERPPAPDQLPSQTQINGMGRAVLQSINALDGGGSVGAPSSYLGFSGKMIPAWAVQLLAFALILPVVLATIDGMARVRRRGHPILRWAAWVVAGAVPFVLAALIVRAAHAVGAISDATTVPFGGGAIQLHAGELALMAVLAFLIVAGVISLRWLSAAVLHLRRGGEGAYGDGAAAGLMLVLCVLALAVWLANPFAALLLVPALHLWMWIVVPDVKLPLPAVVVLVLAGLALPFLVAAQYAITLGLSPLQAAWSWTLLLGSGGFGLLSVIEWSLFLGCAIGVVAIARGSARQPRPEPVPVTIRGPVTYAGPGSLGGTKSALRR
ncbi:MAG TPA: hypothetical protein VGI50_05355 [Solirubrobacteraceae bacterium]|jgi:hypothetical protein